MNTSPRRFRRGDTSPERSGLVFLRYGKTRSGQWREEWVTPSKIESFKKIQYAKAKQWRQTPGGKVSTRRSVKKQRDSGYFDTYALSSKFIDRINSPANRLAHNYRSRMRIALQHRGVKKNSKTKQTLGCSFEFFREWIESKFQPGMSMDNYGTEWVIDHVLPVASFNLFDPEQLKLCFHYSNCQPLWKEENHYKNDRYEMNGKVVNGRFVKQTAA